MTDHIHTLLTQLQQQVNISDISGGKDTLNQLKIALIDASSEPQRLAKLTALEFGVLLSVADGDMDAFERNMSQAKAMYMSGVYTGDSCKILGLNLMYLLVSNNLSEFHSELELLSENEEILQSPFLAFPVQLEQRLMVGSYDMVSSGAIPDASYAFFMDSLMLTVRDSIAECLESAYRTLTLSAAQRMLGFGTLQELEEYMSESRDDWIVENGELCFQPPPMGRQASDIPSMKLIAQSLTYATELERIV